MARPPAKIYPRNNAIPANIIPMTRPLNTTPDLEAPGAGLPPEELKRALESFHKAFDQKPRSYYETLFDSERKNMRQLVEAIPADQRATPVLIDRIRGIEDSSRNWSAYMTLEHLHVCNVIFLDIIQKLIRGGTEPMTTVLPENVKPAPESDQASRTAFEQSAKQFQQTVTRIGDLKTEATHPHPWLGELDAAKWLALSAVHMKIHRQQIEHIKEGLEA